MAKRMPARYRECDDSVVVTIRIPRKAWDLIEEQPGTINKNVKALICKGLGLDLAQLKAARNQRKLKAASDVLSDAA